jgi:hypothetical protein
MVFIEPEAAYSCIYTDCRFYRVPELEGYGMARQIRAFYAINTLVL